MGISLPRDGDRPRPQATSERAPQRADALDAMRGLAVLMMVFSGTIPRGTFPAWMYHAQLPPPTHTFDPSLPGLTWVDLVFPIFLFSMGAAIPLALNRRIAKAWSTPRLVASIGQRGLFLATFAIGLQHVRPYTLNPEPTAQTWWLALGGFAILSLMFLRWPKSETWLGINRLPEGISEGITIAAWCIGGLFLMQLRYPDQSGFSLQRSDIILLVLANMAVFGSVIWLGTRMRLGLRLGCLGLLLALRLSSTADGWVATLWHFSPVPWLFQWDYLKYLFIVIPGTIVGDLIHQWLQRLKAKDPVQNTWHPLQFFSLLLLMLVMIGLLLAGLQARLIWQTTLVAGLLGGIGLLLVRQPVSPTEWLLQRFYHWGSYWLILGLLLEPFENGIKKDVSTLSYYFVTTGIACLLLIALTTMIHVFSQKPWLQLFISNGLNPMLAYMGFANLVMPILSLTHWDDRVKLWAITPTQGLLRGLAYTLILAITVYLCTRLQLFLRT